MNDFEALENAMQQLRKICAEKGLDYGAELDAIIESYFATQTPKGA